MQCCQVYSKKPEVYYEVYYLQALYIVYIQEPSQQRLQGRIDTELHPVLKHYLTKVKNENKLKVKQQQQKSIFNMLT